MSNQSDQHFGCGLDLGTMNILSARQQGAKVVTSRIRDAFIDLDAANKKSLRLSQVDYIEKGDQLVVIGDSALNMANLFKREVRRPLSRGIISAGELEAQQVLSLLVKHVLGDPLVPGEHCFFSVPASPVDDTEQDVVYHTEIFKKIISEYGYTPHPMNEAMAIVYSQCADSNFSGLTASFGCLTPDTHILTRHGYIPIERVVEGDEVLTRTGEYKRVLKAWRKQHTGSVYRLSFYGNPLGVTLTGNHKVWVQRNNTWSWIPAEDLALKDVVGEPIMGGTGKNTSICLYDRMQNGPFTKKTVLCSSSLGRFLGYFLADGHLGPDTRDTIWFDFGPNEQLYADDVRAIASKLFHRKVTFHAHGEAIRCQMSHRSLAKWLRDNCYGIEDAKRVKKFPFPVESLKASVALGFVVGLVRGDGWTADSQVFFGNTSVPLVTAYYALLNRLGLAGTLHKRAARGTQFKDGREILASSCSPEWSVIVSGVDGQYLRDAVESSSPKASKLWRDGGFRCTRIRAIEEIPYEGEVCDLTVEDEPSFCAPYITLHNSGMVNIALAYQTIMGLSFSCARAGDWCDAHAAKAVGATASRMCSIKERGVNLVSPNGREEEALALYIRELIRYCLNAVSVQFKKVQASLDLPEPIPFIVSGGTSKAGGFLDLFKEEFESVKKRGFPIQISEIKHARDPMTAVAEGLLVLATEEHAG